MAGRNKSVTNVMRCMDEVCVAVLSATVFMLFVIASISLLDLCKLFIIVSIYFPL